MIRSITLDHYRSWADRHEIPLRPLTFVYGGNSAGKSSIWQALRTLRWTFRDFSGVAPRLRCDRSLTDDGSALQDIAFLSVVHGGMQDRRVGIGVTVDPPASDRAAVRVLAYFTKSTDGLRGVDSDVSQRGRLASLRLERGNQCAHLSVGAEGLRLNSVSPALTRRLLAEAIRPESTASEKSASAEVALGYGMFLPNARFEFSGGRPGRVLVSSETRAASAGARRVVAQTSEAWRAWIDELFDDFEAALTRIVHIGPLRRMPAFEARRSTLGYGVGFDGSATAGVLLEHRDDGSTVEDQVNRFLQSKPIDKIGAACQVRARPHATGNPSVGDIVWIDVHPKHVPKPLSVLDVGAGVQQLVPVLAQIHAPGTLATIVEQPELHLHPQLALQVAQHFLDVVGVTLGRKSSGTVQIIAETHSDEIVMRLRRRIRNDELDMTRLLLLYVRKTDGKSEVSGGRFDTWGVLLNDWNEEFFREAIEEMRGNDASKR